MTLMRTPILVLLSAFTTAAAALAGFAQAQGAATPGQPQVIQAQPIRSAAHPMSRAEGREAADSALAGALVGTITEELALREPVQVMLETVDMAVVSPRDRHVTGTGLMKVGDDTDWLPFRYRALYDTETQTANGGRITLGRDDRQGQPIALADARLRQLEAAASQRMQQEFPQQAITLDVSAARQFQAGRYQRYVAVGTTRFDAEEATQARIEGLYDPARDRWLRMGYELGDTARWVSEEAVATAAHPEP